MLLATAAFVTACSAADGTDPAEIASAETAAAELTATSAEALRTDVATARIVRRSATARVLELVDGAGRVVATYYPGFFVATQLVPDIAGNTGEIIAERNRGTWLLAATVNPRTGVVAVAVRSFIYAETSFDMVYRFDTRSAAFRANPYGSASASLVPFDGRQGGVVATANVPTRPFLDIEAGGLSYDSAGRLIVRVADASGGRGPIAYNPDLTPVSCVIVGGEGRRCPLGL
jgi:hypothetical protein